MKNFQNLSVQDYVRIARRRIWYVIIPTILLGTGSAIFVSRMPSVYKSETTIMVSDRFPPEDYVGSLVRQSVVDRIEFAKQQLQSRTFVERIAQEFQLVRNGTVSEGVLNTVITSTEITVLSSNVFKIGFYSTDPNTAQAVTRRLVERVMQTNNALRQEKVTVADQFLEDQLRQASDEVGQTEEKLRDFNQRNFPGLPEQGVSIDTLAVIQSQLAGADAELQRALDQRAAFERSLAEQQDLKLVASTPAPPPETSATSIPAPTTEALPPSPLQQKLAQKNSELAALRAKYTPDHPDVVRLTREIRDLASGVSVEPKPVKSPDPIGATEVRLPKRSLPEIDLSVDFYEAELQRELEQLNREIAAKQMNKKDLSNKLTIYSRRLNMPPNVLQEFSKLVHDRDEAKQRYTYLSTKKFTSDLAGKVDIDINNKTFTTIDPPNLPQTPVRPDRLKLTGLGILGSLLFGIGLVFAREGLDPSLSNGEVAASELKLPIFTSIPSLAAPKDDKSKHLRRPKKKASPEEHVLMPPIAEEESKLSGEFSIEDADSRIKDVVLGRIPLVTEQYQMIHAQVFGQKQKGLKTLMITSAIPREGKTFVACCLAGILAKERGKKVLLLDADLRTGKAGYTLGIKNYRSRSGLSDVLSGTADVENCLLSCADLNLSFLPAGNPKENPVDLLTSPRLQQVIYDLSVLFDWIIVDSPPVLPVADATLLPGVCDGAIVVIRAEKTPISLIKQSLDKIGRECVAGIVMNSVRDIKATQYYYGEYYNHAAQAQK